MSETVLVIDASTGESYERALTDEEIAQRLKDTVENDKWIADEEARLAKKEIALAKLSALGLDADDLKALGL